MHFHGKAAVAIGAGLALAAGAGAGIAVASTGESHPTTRQAATRSTAGTEPAVTTAGARGSQTAGDPAAVGAGSSQPVPSEATEDLITAALTHHRSYEGSLTLAEADFFRLVLAGQVHPNSTMSDAWTSIVRAAADYLGLSVQALQDDIGSGQSLAEIAVHQRRTVNGLKTAITDATQTIVNEAVSRGVLPPAGADDLMAVLGANIDALLDARL